MNKKGFTLIELLAVIVIIGLLAILIVPNIISSIKNSKESSYNTLIKNVVTSAQMYYEECEYGNLSDEDRYGDYACSITNDNKITTTLGTLANVGFLKVSDTKIENGKEVKAVLNPKNDNDISSCQIVIEKISEEKIDVNGIKNIKLTYKISGSGTNCPTSTEYEGAE